MFWGIVKGVDDLTYDRGLLRRAIGQNVPPPNLKAPWWLVDINQ